MTRPITPELVEACRHLEVRLWEALDTPARVGDEALDLLRTLWRLAWAIAWSTSLATVPTAPGRA